MRLSQSTSPQSTALRYRVALGIAGGVAGFLVGPQIGAALDRNCQCHEPGFRGAVIGLFVGPPVGAFAFSLLAK
jgi:hypothetical protein